MECGPSVGATVGMEGGSHGPESMVKEEARVCKGVAEFLLRKLGFMFGFSVRLQ